MSAIRRLPLGAIERDMLLQPRAELHQEWVEDYAHDMINGAAMPPVVVFRDADGRHWLADGFHRAYAAEGAGLADILAEVREGTRRDALLFSLSANAEHGHRRTNEDKRRAVDIMLNDPEWVGWSDREIARQVCVDNATVSRRRQSLSVDLPQIPTRRVSRNGTTYEMNTANIGARSSDVGIDEPRSDHYAVASFDWEAARIRREALDPIRALANQGPPRLSE
jgi:hypothetical protein